MIIGSNNVFEVGSRRIVLGCWPWKGSFPLYSIDCEALKVGDNNILECKGNHEQRWNERLGVLTFVLISSSGSSCDLDEWLCDRSAMFIDNGRSLTWEHRYFWLWSSTTYDARSTSSQYYWWPPFRLSRMICSSFKHISSIFWLVFYRLRITFWNRELRLMLQQRPNLSLSLST